MQESALQALRNAAESFERPAFPCALIAGDVVILNLLEKLGYLSSGKVPIIFIDTFHLFSEDARLYAPTRGVSCSHRGAGRAFFMTLTWSCGASRLSVLLTQRWLGNPMS